MEVTEAGRRDRVRAAETAARGLAVSPPSGHWITVSRVLAPLESDNGICDGRESVVAAYTYSSGRQ